MFHFFMRQRVQAAVIGDVWKLKRCERPQNITAVNTRLFTSAEC